jgi:TonB family protein
MSGIRTLATLAFVAVVLALVGTAASPTDALRNVDAGSAIQHSAQEDDVVRVGGDVKPPRKIKHVSPVYPPEAREAGIQGVVILEIVIGPDGLVKKAEVVKSVPELDAAAVEAVLQWEFEPTHVNGKAVSVRMTITVNFTLSE